MMFLTKQVLSKSLAIIQKPIDAKPEVQVSITLPKNCITAALRL